MMNPGSSEWHCCNGSSAYDLGDLGVFPSHIPIAHQQVYISPIGSLFHESSEEQAAYKENHDLSDLPIDYSLSTGSRSEEKGQFSGLFATSGSSGHMPLSDPYLNCHSISQSSGSYLTTPVLRTNSFSGVGKEDSLNSAPLFQDVEFHSRGDLYSHRARTNSSYAAFMPQSSGQYVSQELSGNSHSSLIRNQPVALDESVNTSVTKWNPSDAVLSSSRRNYVDGYVTHIKAESNLNEERMTVSLGNSKDSYLNLNHAINCSPQFSLPSQGMDSSGLFRNTQAPNDKHYCSKLTKSPVKKFKADHSTNSFNPNLYQSPVFSDSLTQAEKFLMVEKAQSEALMKLSYPTPITHVYNPLDYAWEPHSNYVTKYCQTDKRVLFLGMNPGPFGMAQNGVPFGETECVRDWLKITGTVNRPANEHPRRPITGLHCSRREVSGSRFWGFWKKMCGSPENFFRCCFVHNICPLVFMSLSGKNVTPPQIPIATRRQINSISDQALRDIVRILGVKVVVGIGKFAEERARYALGSLDESVSVRVEVIMHPSPCNPMANKGWEAIVMKQLDERGLLDCIGSDLFMNKLV